MATEPEGLRKPTDDGTSHRSAEGTSFDETFSKSFKPKIIAFCCNWCSYAGADLAGVSRFQYPPNARIIRVMCSGRVEPRFVFRAFEKGADGVLVTGCHIGDCHYISGNKKAEERMEMVKSMIAMLGLEEDRFRLEWISASEGQKFAEVMTEFTGSIKELGPNPIFGENNKGED